MSTKYWVGLAVVSTAIAWAVISRAMNEPPGVRRITARDLSHYPDTGYHHWQLAPAANTEAPSKWNASRIPVEVAGRVVQVDFVDDIHPDEDLLLGSPSEAPAPTHVDQPRNENTGPSNLSPADQLNASAVPPEASRPTGPTTNSPPGMMVQPGPLQAPPAAREAIENLTNAGAPSMDRETRNQSLTEFDPDIPPAADEDLLQGPRGEIAPPASEPTVPSVQMPGSGSDSTPVEVLPRTQAPNVAPPSPDTIVETPSRTSPPAEPPPIQSPPFPPGPASPPGVIAGAPGGTAPPVDPHAAVFAESLYPSARKCRECHQQIYDEWAISSHAYASISPMFQKFEQTITCLTRGTLGFFCMRCHAPIATALSYPRYGSLLDDPDLPDSAREGVTCIACHRVREQYGKANGERRIEPGDIHDPVYGADDGRVLADVIRRKSEFKVKTDPGDTGPGVDIHRTAIQFPQLSDSSFCASCHQVFVAPGIELEVVWEQYRASPACKQGISCQDCHMGAAPGVAAGYETAPVAIVNNKPVSPNHKHSNHSFHGPGYSIAHPGIFPFNKNAEKWSTDAWLKFDWRGGWGREDFEDALEDGKFAAGFPKEWENADDRRDAREVLDANLQKLMYKREMRRRLYENTSHVEGPVFDTPARAGQALKFHYVVSNLSNGHNMPSGSLGAQPQLWLNVALTGPQGQHLWESGYVDANGDICDVHSLEVAAGRARRDQQLFNLQTKFLITHVKGTDREMSLPINTDIDQLPFIRPSAFPITVMNHPPFIRMEAHSIPALGSRKAVYKVPARFLQQPGQYRLSVRMRSRAEPIYFMRFCNATREMEQSMNEWMLDFHEHATEFWVH